MKHQFGAAPPGSLGVEEEVFLVDAVTLETAPVYSRVFGRPRAGFKPELFECLVELTTPILPDAEAALAELRRLRAELAALVEARGIRLHAAGSHALACGDGQPIVPTRHYKRLSAALGSRIYRQLVCGLHVHVSMSDPETCLRAFEAVVPWLPTLLALSANSPFAEGKETGRRSARAERLLELPSGGTPPVLRSWDDWTAATKGDGTRRHWDAWPRPEYGTLEVRVMDMQTDVRRSAGLAAIIPALVAAGVAGPRPETYDRELYAQRRLHAAVAPPEPDEVAALAAVAVPRLAAGVAGLVELVLDGPPEAERQLDVATAEGIAAVPRDVIERTVAFG